MTGQTMQRSDILAKITELLADIIDDDALKLADSTTADDVEGWDSLSHVKLMVAIEREYSIRFEPKEITAPQNVGELIDLIQRKL